MKKILFLTGTRADFGKIKTLIQAVTNSEQFECEIFVTGMHTLSLYGDTQIEVAKAFGRENMHVFHNQHQGEPMEAVLANTIQGLSRYIHEHKPDMLVIHGDRVEALAGAITGAINNILVAHIEGGERSGTIDESIRHSVSKMSHLHFVANEEARSRLIQMGEAKETLFCIGSPETDIMLSPTLPSLEEVKEYYEFNFNDYAIVLYHPVTTRLESLEKDATEFVDALLASQLNYLVIYPNNDKGSDIILKQFSRLSGHENFRIYPSIKFESFLVFLKHSNFIIGNSSVGIREAPSYNIPSLDIGDRQNNRLKSDLITKLGHYKAEITSAIKRVSNQPLGSPPKNNFGSGNSANAFIEVITRQETWNIDPQKTFIDINMKS
ncbi:MAG: UDP-N-acetylglucosamine 2-epimerase (hydrolyzing) [Oleispira sp.]|nr:UDP-N-acetylglucosamine 2-epimerase (hydrolyzing) [Oleispira sp.]MBL4881170.1 UDP-N-acetylglucosamine 2-epimerase (hydrolyzing) [Oleispira sp.]